MANVKILVVEDDAVEAMGITRTLESFGYQVPYVASRGEEAVIKASELMPDLILMDIILKGKINGIEAAYKIKKHNMPLIFLTSHSEESTVQKAKLTGPYGYLIKPFSVQELKFTIELALFKASQEKKLKESEENFKTIAENANEGILIGVDKGIHVYANRMAAEITGYTIEELLKTSISDLAHLNEINNLMERFTARISGKNLPITYETKMIRKDGSIVPIEYTAAKTVWKGQRGVMILFSDITERKKAEKKLKMASVYNRSLIEASLDPLVTIGPDGKITDVNKATEKATGHPRDKLIGTDFSNYFTEPRKAKKGYEQVFKEGLVRDYALEIQNQNGKVTPVLYNATVYKDENEEVIGVFAAARDITQLKKAEEKIQMLANVVESSDDAIISKSLEGNITSWNKGAELIYGYSAKEVLGEDISILAPSQLKDEIKLLIEKIKQGKHVIHFETVRVRKDGKEINVSLTLSPLFDSGGNLVGISTIARDISQRKQADIALQDSEKKYRNIFEESFDGLFITSPEGRILDMNKKGVEMFGYDDKEEILCLDLERDVYADPTDRKKILAMVNKEGSAEYEVVVKKKNGDEMITQCSLTAVKEDGIITSYRSIIRDITEHKKAEEAIIKAKEEWENTFDAVPDLIAILDTNFKVIRANKAMANKLNVKPQNTVGLTCYKAVHGLDEPPSFCPHLKLLEDGQEHTTEIHEDRIGGDFIVSVSPLYDSKGNLMGSVHVARDITERKKADNQIKKSLKEKELLLKEIHHRVKNSLQIISSLLDLQKGYVKNNSIAINVLKESQDRVKAMATIYENLYLSKDLTKINFNHYIQSLLQGLFYSHTAKEGQIIPLIEVEDIMLNIETAIPCGLIISELISNSLKHAFPEGKKGNIRIALRPRGNEYELLISDNGIGIPENIDFKNTNTLGFKLINNLVSQIDGKITLDKSHGTKFKITFRELKYRKRI